MADKEAEKSILQSKPAKLVAELGTQEIVTDNMSNIELKVVSEAPPEAGELSAPKEEPSASPQETDAVDSSSKLAENPAPTPFTGSVYVPNPLLQVVVCIFCGALLDTILGHILGLDRSKDFWHQHEVASLYGHVFFYFSYAYCWSTWPENISRAVAQLTSQRFAPWSVKRRFLFIFPPLLWLGVLILVILINPSSNISTPLGPGQAVNNWAATLAIGAAGIHMIGYLIAHFRLRKEMGPALAKLAEKTGKNGAFSLSPLAQNLALIVLPLSTLLVLLSRVDNIVLFLMLLAQLVWYNRIAIILKRLGKTQTETALAQLDCADEKILQYRPFAAMERWWKQRMASRSFWKTGFIGVILLVGGYVAIEHPTALADGFAALVMAINTGKLQGAGGTGSTPAATDAIFNFAFIQFISWAILIASVVVLRKVIKAARGLTVGANGLRFVYGRFNKQQDAYVPWSDISKIELLRPEGRTTTFDDQLILRRASGKPFKIAIGSLPEAADKEALLKAFDKFAPTVPRPAKVIEVLTTNIDNSYTELWLQALAAPPKRERLKPMVSGAKLSKERYEIIRELGVGGQGFAYLAHDNENDNPNNPQIVLKEFVLPVFVDINARKQALDRFEKEARLLTRLEHPKVVKLTGFFVEDHRAYLALEHIDGENLRQLVTREGALPEERVRSLAAQMAEILTYLHGLTPALVHRDFTPDNLILNKDGQLKLIDFNVAHEVESATTGTVVGKQAYLPPEQFRGQPTTKSDLYAMGATLYFLLTGKDPVPISMSSPLDEGAKVSAEFDHLVKNLTAIEETERPDAEEVTKLIGTDKEAAREASPSKD